MYPTDPATGAVQPFVETVKTYEGPQSVQSTVGPMQRKAYSAQDAAVEEQKAALGAQAEIEKQRESLAAQQADEEAVRLQYKAQQEEIARAERDVKVNQLQQEQEARKREMLDAARATGQNYWDDKSGWKKALAVISVGMGGAYAARTGQANPGLAILQDNMNRDASAKENRAKAAALAYQQSTGDIDTAKKIYSEKMVDVNNQIQIRNELLAKQLEAMAKKFPQATASYQAALAAISKESSARAAQNAQFHAAKVTSEQNKNVVRTVTGEKPGEGKTNEDPLADTYRKVRAKQISEDFTKYGPPKIESIDVARDNAKRLKLKAKIESEGVVGYLQSKGMSLAGAIPKELYAGIKDPKEKLATQTLVESKILIAQLQKGRGASMSPEEVAEAVTEALAPRSPETYVNEINQDYELITEMAKVTQAQAAKQATRVVPEYDKKQLEPPPLEPQSSPQSTAPQAAPPVAQKKPLPKGINGLNTAKVSETDLKYLAKAKKIISSKPGAYNQAVVDRANEFIESFKKGKR